MFQPEWKLSRAEPFQDVGEYILHVGETGLFGSQRMDHGRLNNAHPTILCPHSWSVYMREKGLCSWDSLQDVDVER